MDPGLLKKTQDTLGKIIKKPPLTDKLLGKPPFRFLHDVMTSVIKTTGFMKGLYSESEMNSENVKEKEAKVAFLQKSIDMVVAVTGQSVAAKPAKIVAGHEPERTNEFLQALATAINANVDNDEYVKRVLSGEGGGGGGGGESKKERGEKEEKKERDKDRTHSASRRKDDDKRKKEDKEKSHDRDKDREKRHKDRDEEGHEEKDKHRDGREKSRDREDRHRDKDRDKDRERRKKSSKNVGGGNQQQAPPPPPPSTTTTTTTTKKAPASRTLTGDASQQSSHRIPDKSGRAGDKESVHSTGETALSAMKGAISLKPHTNTVVSQSPASRAGSAAKQSSTGTGGSAKTVRKPDEDRSKASSHGASPSKASVQGSSPSKVSSHVSNPSRVSLQGSNNSKLSSQGSNNSKVSSQGSNNSKVSSQGSNNSKVSSQGSTPSKASSAQKGGSGGVRKATAVSKSSVTSTLSSTASPQTQSAMVSKAKPPKSGSARSPEKENPLKDCVGKMDKNSEKSLTQSSAKSSRTAEASPSKTSRKVVHPTVASTSFPPSPERQEARQRKHRDAPRIRHSPPPATKQSSSPALESPSRRPSPKKVSRPPTSSVVTGVKQGGNVPSSSPQSSAQSPTKPSKNITPSSVQSSGPSSTKSVCKGSTGSMQPARQKKTEAQETVSGDQRQSRAPSGSRRSSLQHTADGGAAPSSVTSVQHKLPNSVAKRALKSAPNNKMKTKGDIGVTGSNNLFEDGTWITQLTPEKLNHFGASDILHNFPSSPGLSPCSLSSDVSECEGQELLSPQHGHMMLGPRANQQDDSMVNKADRGKNKPNKESAAVVEVTFAKDTLYREERGSDAGKEPQERSGLSVKAKASVSCYNLPEEQRLFSRHVYGDDRHGKEVEEKENESPEQNGEKDAPSRLQRPTSAKGARRRRQGREAPDDDDEEFQQRENHEPTIGENDLPPQVTAARKMARPPSARPAPPRPKQDGVEAEPAMRLGTGAPANVIVDDGKQSDDEDENFLVEESAPPPPPVAEPVSSQAEPEDDAEHGALVKKMLESKKEAEQQQQPTKKTEIERPALSDAQRRKQRELVAKEIERLQTSIQSLTRSANPLGKIMDYVQEDMDSMQKELDRWRSENKEHALALRRERNVTDRAIEPLKAQLADLDRAITDQLDLIAASKSNIMRNDRRIEKMLQSIARS